MRINMHDERDVLQGNIESAGNEFYRGVGGRILDFRKFIALAAIGILSSCGGEKFSSMNQRDGEAGSGGYETGGIGLNDGGTVYGGTHAGGINGGSGNTGYGGAESGGLAGIGAEAGISGYNNMGGFNAGGMAGISGIESGGGGAGGNETSGAGGVEIGGAGGVKTGRQGHRRATRRPARTGLTARLGTTWLRHGAHCELGWLRCWRSCWPPARGSPRTPPLPTSTPCHVPGATARSSRAGWGRRSERERIPPTSPTSIS